MSQFEIIVSAAILLAMIFLVWRSGRANPDTTGSLGKKMGAIDARLKIVERSIEDLPTVKDVEGLRGDVKSLKTEISHVSKAVDGVDAATVRIEQHLLAQSAPRRGR